MTLDNRTKSLIAIGAAMAANCQSCLEYHMDKALESEVAGREITEAIEVGKTVRKGAASKMDEFASTINQSTPATVTSFNDGCGCAS